MKLYCILFGITLLLSFDTAAQPDRTRSVSGVVVSDSTSWPLEFVNVVLHTGVDSATVTGCVTGKAGKFRLLDVATGEYYLTCNLIGYAPKRTQVFVIDQQHRNLNVGDIRLVPVEVLLEEVLVSGEKSLFNATIDRKVYNVGQDLMSNAGSASDVLHNVPSVQVDIDGNVSLRGSSNVLFMINGRTSLLMNKNSAEVLQQMPAISIERIEVITNPSAKYKPDGSSGIINIVLKKNVSLGINGTLGANLGNQDRYGSNIRLNFSSGQLNVFASYGIRKDNRNRINTDNRVQADSLGAPTLYDDKLNSFARPLSHNVSLGADYSIDAENQVGLSGNYFYNGFTRTENSDKLLMTGTGVAINRYLRDRIDYEFEKEYGFKTFFEHKFLHEDHTLRLELSMSGAPETEDNHYSNTYLLPPGPNSYDNTLIKNRESNTQISLEYANPLPDESQLEAGYAGEFRNSDLDYHAELFDAGQQQFIVDLSKTNRFLFDEAVNALFVTYKHSFGTFKMLAGLRGEHVTMNSNLVTLNTVVANSYNGLYPSLHLSYGLSKGSEIQVSYSRRTRRPEADELNPFPEYRDPRNVSMGNPKLLPEYAHSLELGYQYQNDLFSILPALFYRYTYNRFTSVTEVVNDTLLRTTRKNLETDQSGGLEMILSANIGEFAVIHWNASAFLNQIDASNLGFAGRKSITTWNSSLTFDLNLTSTSRIQVNSSYNASRLTPQGEYSPGYVLNLGFRQKLLENRLMFTLTVADLLKSLKRELALNTPSLNQTVVNKRDSRVFYLSLMYHFGVQPQKAKEEQMRYEDNL